MSVLAHAMLIVFIVAWFIAAAGHIYGSRYFLPMWKAGFKKRPDHIGYRRKALAGYGIFIAAIVAGFAAGGIAEIAGGWN